MKIQLIHSFADIISIDNLLVAWQEFLAGKRGKLDVQEFGLHLFDNILQLYDDLANKSYRHSGYIYFRISDPKPRNIHKASVRDRLLHHSIYRILYPFFDKTFIADSYSCRDGKGTHKAMRRFEVMSRKVSRNDSQTCWVLQCDIKQFFASIVTSQLFVNIYMNEFDQFVKHDLKTPYYIRYADDFVFLSNDREQLVQQLALIHQFLESQLHLTLHPYKVSIQTLASGIDFLGWVNFPTHRVLRTTTKRRMLRRLSRQVMRESVQSYIGLLRHGNAYRLEEEVRRIYVH